MGQLPPYERHKNIDRWNRGPVPDDPELHNGINVGNEWRWHD